MRPPLLSLLSLSLSLIPGISGRYTLNLPPLLTPGPIQADYRTPSLTQSDLDSPKLPRANTSTFDWWSFDAISLENPNAAVSVTFSNAGPDGYPLDLPDVSYVFPNGTGTGQNAMEGERGALYAHVAVTFPDGRSVRHIQPVESARMHGSGDSSVAIWHGAGGWMGSEEGYEVELVVNNTSAAPGNGTGSGSEGITNPHTLCSTPTNFSEALALGDRGLGWVGVLPDAMARVDVTVNGERLMFDGYGFHDKIWSTSPFTSSTGTLHRGRAHLGLYSLVWVSYTPSSPSSSPTPNPIDGQDRQTITSHFLARDGEVISSGCAPDSVSIVPGTEQTEGGLVSGFRLSMPGVEVSVAGDNEVLDGPGGSQAGNGNGRGHSRWHGRARGMIEGNDEEGVAVFERFEY
ncbi:uncharacterized protein BDV14DRAFT_209643 [Aspergillus stella-maris]|uniref:uncharacterized protein n=1 Tax=Aspergillus stella-maris TaxID=1810926 RepID=UPI003CCD6C1B